MKKFPSSYRFCWRTLSLWRTDYAAPVSFKGGVSYGATVTCLWAPFSTL